MGSVEEAKELASYIRIGSLSLELEEIRSSVVAAQLGEEAISTSVIAGAIGLVIVMLFMIIIYRVPGVVASLALILYTAIMLITLNAFDITLTLPGIAGIILGIGMAVDANVIIYARIREEIGAGSSVRLAIKSGFSKAFSAIFDGNITTLIAACVLMWLGSGSVKGFAYTLALGIIISMFTALVVSRFVIKAVYAVGVHDPKYYGSTVARKPIDFLANRKVFFIISIVVILCGPVAMLIHQGTEGKALNYSLEFSGGTSTTVTFNEDMDIKTIDAEVVPVVEEVTGDKNVQSTKVVGTNQVVIKTRSLDLDERESLNQALVDNFGVDESLISAESISATVSSEMRRDAVVAVIVATICMLLYIWFRFKDIRFASSAVLALVHDVLVVLTFYAISRTSVGNTFIACMLTIVGYSINATIVIFDRIRENLHGSNRIDELQEIVNNSITQTLTRSINTSITTFIMVAVLYILGVSSIREFAAPLMVGIICGAYSSVCVTGALWFVMKTKIQGKTAQPVKVAVASSKAAPKKAVSEQKPSANKGTTAVNQPKKKNRKRDQERLAAQQAANKENK
jgi:SecD/SecF fusion protein